MDMTKVKIYRKWDSLSSTEMIILGEIITELYSLHDSFTAEINEDTELNGYKDKILDILDAYEFYIKDIVKSSFYKVR